MTSKKINKFRRSESGYTNTFKVSLTRTYIVTIQAEDEEKAKRLAEFYVGDPSDRSTENERVGKNFAIEDLEMVYNEAEEILSEDS